MGEAKAKVKDFRDLQIWQRGVALVVQVYQATEKFPKHELYGLVSQARRSAVSIPSNIAEGFSRFRNGEYKRFLYISLGSCAELTTQLIIAGQLGYLVQQEVERMNREIDEISRMIMGLIKKLQHGAERMPLSS